MALPSEVGFGQLLFGGIGMLLLTGGALLAFVATYRRRLLQQQIRAQQAETQHQQQLVAAQQLLLAAVIEAQEEERERIGQDLHDGLGSALATTKLLVSRLGSLPATESPAGVLALLEELTGSMVQDVRSISHNLYPAVLARFGLADALQHLADTCTETGKLPVEVTIRYYQGLDLGQELALYRICQELMTNALKHAQGATHLALHLHQHGPLLTLSVADDGCGFAGEPGQAPGAGAGLRSIAARVQLLHGQLRYLPTATGQGTRTVIEVPLPH